MVITFRDPPQIFKTIVVSNRVDVIADAAFRTGTGEGFQNQTVNLQRVMPAFIPKSNNPVSILIGTTFHGETHIIPDIAYISCVRHKVIRKARNLYPSFRHW